MPTAFDLRLRHLDAARTVARLGSVTAAAGVVNLSQPALTQAILGLERTVGVALFDRDSRGTTPSAAGASFFARVDRAIERLAAAGVRVRRTAKLPPIAYLERRLSTAQIRALVTVERLGNFTLAAREIGLSQPSVHRAVRELGRELGLALFARAGSAIHATTAGAHMAQAARLAYVDLQAGLDELAAIGGESTGIITIGAMSLPRATLLPRALIAFRRAHPAVRVHVVEGDHAELLRGLLLGEIDVMLGALRFPPLPDVAQHALLHAPLHVVARTGHALAGMDAVPAEMLARFPWALARAPSPMRDHWAVLFATAGIDPPEPLVETSSLLVIRGLLLEDDWLTLMSPDQMRIEAAAGLLTTIGPPLAGSERAIGITTRRDWHPTTIQQAIMTALQAAERPTRNE